MKKIILITSSFPYGNGEQFLETEVDYYCDNDFFCFTILPTLTGKTIRKIPKDIKVTTDILSPKKWGRIKYYYLLKSLFVKEFYNEFFIEKFTNPKKIKIFLSSLSLYLFYKNALDKYIKNESDITNVIFYTYWNNEITYALQTLKEKYHFQLVSRIHGGDLYKEVRKFEYIPLKKQFTKNINKIYTITESANKYLESTYNYHKKSLEVSRLGVKENHIKTNPSPADNTLHIVSCSFLNSIKRIDKIIDSLETLTTKKPLFKIKWTHIGAGNLFDQLSDQAKHILNNKPNIEYNFIGNLGNKEVLNFYKTNNIDVFINVSESEGVPVSIMEALSCHIPIIAPNIGGISDLVINKYNGILLSEKGTLNEIIDSFNDISFFKDKTTRENAYQIFLEKYNAESNYSNFLSSLQKL